MLRTRMPHAKIPRRYQPSRRVGWCGVLLVASFWLVVALSRPGYGEVTLITDVQPSRAHGLAALAWIAEGDLSREDRQQAEQRLAGHLAWMEANLPADWGRWSLARRGEWVFQQMHAQLLTGEYQENQHALSHALLKGDYNCVSATMLFRILCDNTGLPTVPLQTRGHVWCRLLGSPELDIETTCPTWFLLEPHVRTQAPAVQAAEGARALTDRGLAAKIPYNKASLAAADGDYAAAIDLLNQALRLDPQDPAALKNRSVIWNNWAVQCVSQHECEQALGLLREIETAAPHDPVLAENRQRIVDDVLDEWCRLGRFSDALRLKQWQEQAEKLAGSSQSSRHSVRSIYEQWIAQATKQGKWFEAKNALRAALAELERDPLAAAQLRRQFRELSPS